ncbi:hypothetical protein CEK60_04650 [Halomonas sp. N3-2A]|nr:hypothetical protein CEK60_04650 [Halomonas sp. N3-2A]
MIDLFTRLTLLKVDHASAVATMPMCHGGSLHKFCGPSGIDEVAVRFAQVSTTGLDGCDATGTASYSFFITLLRAYQP